MLPNNTLGFRQLGDDEQREPAASTSWWRQEKDSEFSDGGCAGARPLGGSAKDPSVSSTADRNGRRRIYFQKSLEQLQHSHQQLLRVERLLSQYQGFVHRIARKFSAPGADVEDLLQEGRIGLFKAIVNYDPGRGLSFEDFASLCIRNEIQAAFKRAFRQTRVPTVSLERSEWDTDELPDLELSPEDRFCRKATRDEISRFVGARLRGLERHVFLYYLAGLSPTEICARLRVTHKQVDNAFQRAKKRLRELALRESF